MRLYFLYFIFFIFLPTGIAKSQLSARETPQMLEELFDRLAENYNDNSRITINDSIMTILDSYVKSDTVFRHRFTNLRYLGQILSPDSLLKIITWNLVLENESGRYFCYFIRKQVPGGKNLIYRLSSNYNEVPIKTDTTYTESEWYGALYYDLKPYIIDNQHCWILLGIDYGNAFISRKIIDVLSFTLQDAIVFGRKWFVSGEDKKYRAVFQYASYAMMSLKFRSDSSIIFDHLVPFNPSLKEDRQYFGPDYSSDAYNLENGFWKLIINVEARNQ